MKKFYELLDEDATISLHRRDKEDQVMVKVTRGEASADYAINLANDTDDTVDEHLGRLIVWMLSETKEKGNK